MTGINAQETKTIAENINNTNEVVKSYSDSAIHALNSILLEEDTVCYSEISKVTFYEALIRQNNFDINLKESDNIALKNTEDIIKNNKDRVSYSE